MRVDPNNGLFCIKTSIVVYCSGEHCGFTVVPLN